MVKYPNLPGITTYIIDGGANVEVDETIPKQVVLGTVQADSFQDGTPILFNEPYLVPTTQALTSLFASSPLANTLTVLASGSGSQLLPVGVRIGYPEIKFGVHNATGIVWQTGDNVVTNVAFNNTTQVQNVAGLNVEGPYTGRFNGTLFVKIETNQNDVESMDGVKYSVSFDGGQTYDTQYTNLDATVQTTIKETGLTISFAPNQTGTELTAGMVYKIAVQYARLPQNKEEMYKALTEAYKQLEGLDQAVVVPQDVHIDDVVNKTSVSVSSDDPDQQQEKINFGYQLARFCYNTSTNFRSCVGFIGVNEPDSFGFVDLKAWANKLLTLDGYKDGFFATQDGTMTGQPIVDQQGSPVDIGKHLVVVAGHGTIPAFTKRINLAPYVAGYVFTLSEEVGPTYLELPKATLSYKVPFEIADKLAAQRITPLATEFTSAGQKTIIVVGRTQAMPSSSFTKISTVRVQNEVMQGLREIAKNYLGKPNSFVNREVMRTEMQNYLNQLASQGKFASQTVQVSTGGIGGSLGTVNVDVYIRAYVEIHDVVINAVFEFVAA